MRALGAGLVLVFVVVGCTSANSVPAETVRPTYEVSGLVYFATDCPRAANLVSAGGQVAGAPLPRKGLTDLDRVEALLSDARIAILPNALEVNLIVRHGEVWDGPFSGAGTPHPRYTVEAVEDYQYEVVLAPDGICPNHPVSWHGIPLLFNRA